MQTLILDLDNTVYPVSSISDRLFPPLFRILEKQEYGIEKRQLEEAKKEIMKRPFQKVAADYQFPEALVEESLELLRNMVYEGEMKCFDDYYELVKIPAQRFLLTTGFSRLQWSKVERLGIENDFSEIFIVDPDHTDSTKRDVISKILLDYQLDCNNVLVVGDDPYSEIQAANDLGIKSFLLDTENQYPEAEATVRGSRLGNIIPLLATNEKAGI